MRKAISKLFGLKGREGARTLDSAHSSTRGERGDKRDNPHTIEDNSDNGTRRQLVQVMLRDGLRKNGIPPGWVECRMLVVTSRSRGQGLYVSLLMRHWDLRLLTYAHAFQQDLRAAINEFEPQSSVWLHGISWELDVGDTCPYVDMPDPSIWLATPAWSAKPLAMPAPVVKAAAPVPVHATAAPAVAATAAALTAQALQNHSVAAVVVDDVEEEAPAGAAEDQDILRDLERMFAIRDADIQHQAFADTSPMDFQNTEPSQRP